MLDPIYRRVGRQIKEHRKAARISQRDLAKASNLSRASISNIEAGRQQVYLHHVIAIALALELDPRLLLPTSEDSLLSTELERLDSEAKAFVSAGVKELSK